MDEFIGKKVGGYEIESKLGQGGMATVYRARQTSMNRTVALKVLPRHFMKDDTYLQRFEREVKIVAQLEHRNIISVYDYGEHDGQPFIAMRYMAAGSVDELLNGQGLSPEKTLNIIEQIAPALDYAHSKNILHRDLKPSNVLLDDNGGAYITDFGIARLTGVENKGNTITTQGVVGTPSYMSPEQAQGKDLDGRSDIYSLGVMLFEMLTGRRPFENDTPYGIAVMQVTTPPPLLRSINPDISNAVEQVVLKALSKNPDNRYQTATEMVTALQQAIDNPDSIHDTQPRPPALLQETLDVTQPNTAQNFDNQATMPSPPPITPVPQYNPPSSVSNVNNAIHPPRSRYMRQPRRKRSNNMWTGILIGGIVGCGLLTILVIAGAYAVGGLFSDDTPDISVDVDVTPAGESVLPPLDATSQSARDDLLADDDNDDTTEDDDTVEPVGVRPTTAVVTGFAPQNARIVYFALRPDEDAEEDLNYDIYYYDFASRQETRLTDSTAVDWYPVPSPDGEQIVFESNRDGDSDIYIMDLDGGNLRKLTNNDVRDRLPAWSPDGEWIVYASDANEDNNFDLYRLRADGGGVPELLLTNGVRNSHPRYSPDGLKIVFTTGESDDSRTWEIAELDIATGDVTYLTNNDLRDASPSYSPRGDEILYVTEGEGGMALAILALSDLESRIIEDHSGREWGGYFSPDGEYIVYNSEQGVFSELFYYSIEDDERIEIDTIGGYYPSWVP